MIDLTRIRSIKTLEEMKADLKEFLTNPDILTVYVEDYKWGVEDYEADREQVEYLLEQVENRMASLSRFLNKPKTTKKSKQSVDTKVTDPLLGSVSGSIGNPE